MRETEQQLSSTSARRGESWISADAQQKGQHEGRRESASETSRRGERWRKAECQAKLKRLRKECFTMSG